MQIYPLVSPNCHTRCKTRHRIRLPSGTVHCILLQESCRIISGGIIRTNSRQIITTQRSQANSWWPHALRWPRLPCSLRLQPWLQLTPGLAKSINGTVPIGYISFFAINNTILAIAGSESRWASTSRAKNKEIHSSEAWKRARNIIMRNRKPVETCIVDSREYSYLQTAHQTALYERRWIVRVSIPIAKKYRSISNWPLNWFRARNFPGIV